MVVERVHTPSKMKQIPRQADPFKTGIEGPLGDGFIRQGIQDIFGDGSSPGKVDDLDFAAIDGIAKKQDFKGR